MIGAATTGGSTAACELIPIPPQSTRLRLDHDASGRAPSDVWPDDHDALLQEALLHEALLHEALLQEALLHEALLHEALLQDAFACASLDQLAASNVEAAVRVADEIMLEGGVGVGRVADCRRRGCLHLADAQGVVRPCRRWSGRRSASARP